MFTPDPAPPLHGTMLSMLHEADRRGMGHEEHSLAVCELLLAVHALTGQRCVGCREPWPCKTVLEIIGGVVAFS